MSDKDDKNELKEKLWKELGEKPRSDITDPKVYRSIMAWWGENVVPQIKAIERAKNRALGRFQWPQ